MISMPLIVGRGRSIKAVEAATFSGGLLIVIAQRTLTPDDPAPIDLYMTGTLCKIEGTSSSEVGSRQVVVTGVSRYHIWEFENHPGGYIAGYGESVPDLASEDTVRSQAFLYNLRHLSREVLELLPGTNEPLVKLLDRVEDPTYLTHICATYLNIPIPEKQALLEDLRVDDRMEKLLSYMRRERETLNLQKEIRDKMSERLTKVQREALLREQLRTIRSELGDEPSDESTDTLAQKIAAAELPEEASHPAAEELRRLRALPPASAEYHVIRTYLEWLASLPWNVKSGAPIDLDRAREVLDHEHYGLENVKRRILQFLAVAQLKNDLHGPILCLVGPPGVGKTSLGHSIAEALGLKFARTSLGGVRDEAEIRGHRRTYVGAMPGRIIQTIKRTGTRNPVFMLDEIDKLRADFHGDPAAAMLEVLDPEQNKRFIDHYLDVPFDLSDVFFICTANVTDTIPAALLDRMEIIEVTGYTSSEKIEIAERHIIPRLIQDHGLKPEWARIPRATVLDIITHYTREAGIRELQRRIAALLRAVAEEIVRERGKAAPGIRFHRGTIGAERLPELLGPPKFFPERAEREMKPGVATGLAWTPHGGDLIFIEATLVPNGKGSLILTGQLGEVMKESAQIAYSLIRSLYPERLKQSDLNTSDLHIHIPAGAIPKDGPSAGVTLLAALNSLLENQPLPPEIAMTGEITLRGAILPVGGIKEKVLAAHRAGLKTVFLPAMNEQDASEIPPEVRKALHIAYVSTVEGLLGLLFPPEYRARAVA